MTISRKAILREARDLVFFFLASAVQAYLMCPRCNSFVNYSRVIGFTFLIWILLWKGNERLSHVISKRISWIEFPSRRFFLGVLVTITYTVGAMLIVMTLFEKLLGLNFGSGYLYTVYGSVIITIVISFFLHARQFLMHWRQATIEKEKYEKESIAAKYESLKNQVSPHFLFNSLNALSNLVYEDPDKAVKFIKQLSDVYRYVLDTRDREVVTVEEELNFLKSYIFLQQIRFGEKLKIDIDIKSKNVFMTPLALQMLVENAVKHNVISEEQPLSIKIYDDSGYICVENNLQKRKSLGEPSTGVGLENIQRRYDLLTTKHVEIIATDSSFRVKLPFLKKLDS